MRHRGLGPEDSESGRFDKNVNELRNAPERSPWLCNVFAVVPAAPYCDAVLPNGGYSASGHGHNFSSSFLLNLLVVSAIDSSSSSAPTD